MDGHLYKLTAGGVVNVRHGIIPSLCMATCYTLAVSNGYVRPATGEGPKEEAANEREHER